MLYLSAKILLISKKGAFQTSAFDPSEQKLLDICHYQNILLQHDVYYLKADKKIIRSKNNKQLLCLFL